MRLFWGHCQSRLDDLLCPLYYLIHGYPPPIFARDPWVVPAGTMLFCAPWKLYGSLGGRTGFISRIISRWDSIRWEEEMFHDLSEVDLGFDHFRRECLIGFPRVR